MTSAPIMSGNKVDTWYNNWFDCISGELIAKSSKFIYTITGVCEKNQIILVEQKEL